MFGNGCRINEDRLIEGSAAGDMEGKTMNQEDRHRQDWRDDAIIKTG